MRTADAAAEHSVSPSTLRVRRHRESRRERLRLFTVEVPEDLIDEALARGLLKPEDRADWWAVIQACYAAQLSDVALEWLANGRVITREQRGDAVAILRSISNWLEQAGCSAKWRSEASLQIHDIRRKRYRASTCEPQHIARAASS